MTGLDEDGDRTAHGGSLTGLPPRHLPHRLMISLWDFSWYTRAGCGEPYEDLDAVCAETAALGYNTIRICAAPLLLFGDLGLEDLAGDLPIGGIGPSPAGGYFGQGTRWYNVPGGFALDLRSRLLDLFRAARTHGLVVILSSWEYQQSPAFASSSRWFDAINAVHLAERFEALAAAFDRLIGALTLEGFRGSIALVELHNEVDFSILPSFATGGIDPLQWLQQRHTDLLITASYGKPPHRAMNTVPESLGAAQFHIYSYGVLDALQSRLEIRSDGDPDSLNSAFRDMLVAGAPTVHEYGRAEEWKYEATIVTARMLYGYDWIDPALWDSWLYAHVGQHLDGMQREIESRVAAVAEWARSHGIPAVIGEGWIGYTPLNGQFEEGPLGRALAERGIRASLAQGVWGMVLCSNAAPHHPMWAHKQWQRRMNTMIRDY